MNKTDGGPAFPRACDECSHEGAGCHIGHAGMSLRDWFAGQALVGLLANDRPISHVAPDAYAIADAMLVERAKETP